jgi:hypothetical protein
MALLATACTNVIIAVQRPSIPLVLAALVSGYIGLFVAATVLVVWPLMVDPRRQHLPTGELVRLGLVVIAARPARYLGLVMVEAILVAIGLQTFVAALVLPAFGLSVASWIALPLADAVHPDDVTDV